MSLKSTQRKNLTFRNGENIHLNACVGDNSGIDNRNGYAWGFAVSVKIMLSAALASVYVDAKEGVELDPQIDGLIYPIAFCARHHVELFLKREISYVSSIRGPNRTPPVEHDLRTLWLDFRDTCAKADRFLFLHAEPLEEYVLDFADIDPTGQTFRYALSNDNMMHLSQFSVINLHTFAERFYEMVDLLDKFEVAREVMGWEYAQGTFTNKLARNELDELAKALPKRSDWTDSEKFDEVRNEFIKKYELSSNDFSRAIKKIEKHRQFSAMIGVELPIQELTIDVFPRLRKIYLGAADLELVRNAEWAALSAVCEVGRAHTYNEAYEMELADSVDAFEDGRLDRAHTLRTVAQFDGRFPRGLQRMGQITLHAAYEDNFKNLAKDCDE